MNMKIKRISLMLLTILLMMLMGCGKKAEVPEETGESTAATVEATGEEAESNEQNNEFVEIVKKYGGCGIRDNLPSIGGYEAMPFEDTITGKEDITADESGTYVYVQFSNPENNVIVYDKSRPGEGEADFTKLNEAKSELGQKSMFINDGIPEVGESGKFYKERKIIEIEDLKVMDDEERNIYLIKAEGGNEYVIAVNKFLYMDFVPRKGQVADFSFEDVVISTEDLAPHADGMYSVIHFEDSRHDVVVQDASRLGDTYECPIAVSNKREELNQKDGASYEVNELPEIGSSFSFTKGETVAEVKETDETVKDGQCFVITSVDGMENTVAVKNEDIPDESFALYECGEYDGTVYRNASYGLQITSDKEPSTVAAYTYRTKIVDTQVTYFIEYEYLDNGAYIKFGTFEFVDAVTEERFANLMEEQYSGKTEDGTVNIVGKEYQRAIYQESGDEYLVQEPIILYRMEGNKIYVMKICIPQYADKDCTYDSILAMFSEY